jgi:hypothetical protein
MWRVLDTTDEEGASIHSLNIIIIIIIIKIIINIQHLAFTPTQEVNWIRLSPIMTPTTAEAHVIDVLEESNRS